MQEIFNILSEAGGASLLLFIVYLIVKQILFKSKTGKSDDNALKYHEELSKAIGGLKKELTEQSFLTINNHLHTVDETLKLYNIEINNLKLSIERLSTIIEERIPRLK